MLLLLLALLACLLGHHTLVIAASPNDNGLLHQELVDFELPPRHGWQSRAASTSQLNALRHCERCLDIFQADRFQGVRATQARRRELHNFWLNATRHGPKFVLPRQVRAAMRDASVSSTPLSPAGSCELRFGTSVAEAAGVVDACQLTARDEDSRPTADKACWAWCNGTLSAHALASTSLGHVRFRA